MLNNDLFDQKEQFNQSIQGNLSNHNFSEENQEELESNDADHKEYFCQSDSDKTFKNISKDSQVIKDLHTNNDKMELEQCFPRVLPLIKEKYSLESDMLFGWVPKVSAYRAPIPLIFENRYLDILLDHIQEKHRNYIKYEIIYHGFRPKDTFKLHKAYSNENTYPFKFGNTLFSKYRQKQKFRKNNDNEDENEHFMGMNPKYKAVVLNGKPNMNDEFDNTKRIRNTNLHKINNQSSNIHDDSNDSLNILTFDSNFESGNLDTVIKIGNDEYDLFMRVDSNTRGHTNWYYFKVTGMKKNQKVKFNIMNFSKPDSLYTKGKKPYVYSKLADQYMNQQWHQQADNIIYELSQFGSHDDYHKALSRKKKYWKLSFEYTFLFENDTVYFALCIPYTYSDLIKFIKRLTDNRDYMDFLTQTTLCLSLSGVEVPILHITEHNDDELLNEQKQVIICTARVHPGESNGSWMMHGFIEWICNNSDEAKYLRKKFLFKIIPMLNPDGVILGNHRTCVCGDDLNRQYIDPNEKLHPTIFAIKKLLSKIKQTIRNKIFAYIDFHGHSLKKNVFMYGAEFPLHHRNYYRVRIFPKIISKITQMFRYSACLFNLNPAKVGTSRAVFSQQYDIMNCYTLEASYANYINENKQTLSFDTNLFLEMGAIIGKSLYQYEILIEQELEAKRIRYEQRRLKQFAKQKIKGEIKICSLSGTPRMKDETSGSPINILQNQSPEKNIKSNSDFIFDKGKIINSSNENPKNISTYSNIKSVNSDYFNPNKIKPIKVPSKKPSKKETLHAYKDAKLNLGSGLETYITDLTSLDLSLPMKSPLYSQDNRSINKKIKSKKKANRGAFSEEKHYKNKKEKENDIDDIQPETEVSEEVQIGINSLLKEIKFETNNPQKKSDDLDDTCEGRSDSESSDDDLPKEKMNLVHKDILKKIELFSTFAKRKFKPQMINDPRHPKILISTKKTVKYARVSSNNEIGDQSKRIMKPSREKKSNYDQYDTKNYHIYNLLKIKSIQRSSSPDRERFLNSAKNNENSIIAHNSVSQNTFQDSETNFNIIGAKVNTIKIENKLASILETKKKVRDKDRSQKISDLNFTNFESNGFKIDKTRQNKSQNPGLSEDISDILGHRHLEKYQNIPSTQISNLNLEYENKTEEPINQTFHKFYKKLSNQTFLLSNKIGYLKHNGNSTSPKAINQGLGSNSKIPEITSLNLKKSFIFKNNGYKNLYDFNEYSSYGVQMLTIPSPNQYLIDRINTDAINSFENPHNILCMKLEPLVSYEMEEMNYQKNLNNFPASPQLSNQLKKRFSNPFKLQQKKFAKKIVEEEKSKKGMI